jgi:hypothetical protein
LANKRFPTAYTEPWCPEIVGFIDDSVGRAGVDF